METVATLRCADQSSQPSPRCGLENRRMLHKSQVTAISVVGPGGAGKSSLIEATARHLAGRMRLAVVVGGLAADRDAARLIKAGVKAIAVNKNELAAADLRQALDHLDLTTIDILFIERTGNLRPPFEADLGQDAQVCVFSAAGGDDKAAEYPQLIAESHVVILDKADLMPYVNFDLGVFANDVHRANPSAEVIPASCTSTGGIEGWLTWLVHFRATRQPAAANSVEHAPLPEWFFG